MDGDTISGVLAGIEGDISGTRLGAPSTTDTFENDTIDPFERYAADAPAPAQVFGGDFVLFGYDDSDDFAAQNTRDVLRNALAERAIDGTSVEFRDHEYHPPTFAYEIAVPMLQNPLRRSREGLGATSTTHACCWVNVPPQDYLDVQAAMRGRSTEEFVALRVEDRAEGRPNVTKLERGLRSSEPVVPAPPLELNTDGELIFQEGRTRAFLARELGIPYINVLLAVNKKK